MFMKLILRKAHSNTKNQQVLSSLSMNVIGVNLRNGTASGDIAIVNLHPSKGTHCVVIVNEFFFIHTVLLLQVSYLKYHKTKWTLFIF